MDFLLNTHTSVLSEMKGTSESLNLFLYQFPIFSNGNLFQASEFFPVFGSDPTCSIGGGLAPSSLAGPGYSVGSDVQKVTVSEHPLVSCSV